MHRFCRYNLRTTDVDGAQAFYGELLGNDFWGDGISVAHLPPALAAKGVPAHWLGYIAVNDVPFTVTRLTASGATRLGPPSSGGESVAVLRDPHGAIVALTSENGLRRPERVGWHLMNAQDEVQAFGVYADVFGWVSIRAADLGAGGRHVTYAWDMSHRAAGSVSNMARLPHVHPQWLFFFATADLDGSLAIVRKRGGLALPVTQTTDGHRVAVCDDPQGAAFALFETD